MDNSQEIEQLEVTIDEAKKMANKADTIIRLSKNKDFQQVIEQWYLKDEAVRLAHMYSEPQFDAKTKELIRIDLEAIGALARYFKVTLQLGDRAKDEIAQSENEISRILSGEE